MATKTDGAVQQKSVEPGTSTGYGAVSCREGPASCREKEETQYANQYHNRQFDVGNAIEHRIRPDVGLLLANTVSEAELLNPVTFVLLPGQGQTRFRLPDGQCRWPCRRWHPRRVGQVGRSLLCFVMPPATMSLRVVAASRSGTTCCGNPWSSPSVSTLV